MYTLRDKEKLKEILESKRKSNFEETTHTLKNDLTRKLSVLSAIMNVAKK